MSYNEFLAKPCGKRLGTLENLSYDGESGKKLGFKRHGWSLCF